MHDEIPIFHSYIAHNFQALLFLFEPLEKKDPINIERISVRDYPEYSGGKNKLKTDYINPEGFRRNSPVLFYFIRFFSLLNLYVDVYDHEKTKRTIDGIRVRDNNIWLSQSYKNPNEVLAYISGKCGIKCDFCYLKGNPPFINTLNKSIKDGEILYRLHLFKEGRTIFQRNLLSTDEQTTHPMFLHVLKSIREINASPIFVETNGVNLTRDMINELSSLKSIFLNVSVNVLDHDLRKRVLKDNNPKRIVSNLKLLSESRIPFSVSIVPWHTVPGEEIGNVAHYCSNLDANHIRIRLPGYTSFYSSEKLYDLDEYWSQIIENITVLRKSINTPIFTEPGKYEQLKTDIYWKYPVVLGVIKNSPAYQQDLKFMDYIIKINDQPMLWRNEALKHLLINFMQKRDIRITLLRNQNKHELAIRYSQGSYPYEPDDSRCPYGIYTSDDLDIKSLMRMKEILNSEEPEKAVLISSRLMQKSYRSLIELFNLGDSFTGVEVHVIPNSYFGGNVFMGDLLVVSDIIDYLNKISLKYAKKPDLVFLPSSMFNDYGNDLLGNNYKEIEYWVRTRVFLLPSHIISL